MNFLLDESVKRINKLYLTYSASDVKNILLNLQIDARIVYCSDTELWIIGDANESYHPYMVKDAFDAGYTNINYKEDNFGRFYFIPHSFKSEEELYTVLDRDYVEICYVKAFKDFFIGTDYTSGSEEGGNIFLNMFNTPVLFEGSVKV